MNTRGQCPHCQYPDDNTLHTYHAILQGGHTIHPPTLHVGVAIIIKDAKINSYMYKQNKTWGHEHI